MHTASFKLPSVLGLDLGPVQERSAVALLEPVHPPADRPRYNVPLLRRWPLGTGYLDIAADVARLIKSLRAPPLLVIDQTGVGLPVARMVFKHLIRAEVPG
jgi:hypothetical protein